MAHAVVILAIICGLLSLWIFRDQEWYWLAVIVLLPFAAIVLVNLEKTKAIGVDLWQKRQKLPPPTAIIQKVSPLLKPAAAAASRVMEEKMKLLDRINIVFGYVYTPVAALMWLATIVVVGIAIMPFSQDWMIGSYTLRGFLIAIAPPFIVLLVVVNVLSARWGPKSMEKIDGFSTGLGFWGMVLICIAALGMHLGLADYTLGLPDGGVLAGLLFAGWIDKNIFQAIQFKSSRLREQGDAAITAATQALATGHPEATAGSWQPSPQRQSGPFLRFWEIGLRKIGPLPAPTYGLVDANGDIEIAVDMEVEEVIAVAVEQERHERAVHATVPPPPMQNSVGLTASGSASP